MVCEQPPSETAPSPEMLKTASPESSPSSAESNFRELDDAFLQSQARIWLGEVLQIRLDEQLVISEMLADGELLFRVSKVVWKLLLAKHMELRHIKTYKSQPFASVRNSGRYRPYSNVDSFLKICKILGLTGVDLFSPSDVVERRNTRRVCMCIRSFSKKLRSESIDVPDFDIVTCAVAMPKDMVGFIRRSIELSHRSPVYSSSYYLQKHSEQKFRRVYSVTDSIRDWETYSDQSSEEEIKHPVHQFDALHRDDLYDYASKINYNMPSLMVENVFVSKDLDQLDSQDQLSHEISNDEFQLLCSRGSLQYQCPENVRHDCKLTWSSSPYCGSSHIDFGGVTSHFDTRVQERRIMDFDYFENDLLRDDASVTGTPLNDKIPVTRDVSSHAKDRKDLNLLNEENIAAVVYKSASSHGSSSTPEITENCRCFEIGENMEALHVSGMSCLSREAEALNLEDQLDTENDFQNIESFELHNDKNKIKEEYESRDIMKYMEMAYGITSNARYSYFAKELEEREHSLYCPDCFFCETDSSNIAVSRSNDISSTLPKKFLDEDRKSQVDLRSFDKASCIQYEELLSCQSYSSPEMCKWDQKGKCAMTLSGDTDNKSSSGFSEDGSHGKSTPCKQKKSGVLMSKVLLSCLPNKEEAISEAIVTSSTDGKELKNDCQVLASNPPSVDDSEKCPTTGDDANDFCGKGVKTQDSEDEGQRVLEMITNVAIVSANCEEDVSHTRSCVTSQSSKLECSDNHQASKYEMGPVYHSEHTQEVRLQQEINPEDDCVQSFENLVETPEEPVDIPKAKPQKKILLKSVLGGAAAVGLIFMFMHLRRNSEGKDAQPEPSKAFSRKGNEKMQKHSPQKVKDRSTTTEGVYPAEKLKLK